jgi:hypothetical protein
MKTVIRIIWIALPCILMADPPLTLDDVLARSKTPLSRLNVDAALAEGRRQAKDASSLMRESPTVSVSAGPRTAPGASSSTDQTIEIDTSLMLNRAPAKKLASSLESSAPTLYSAADLENRLAIHQAFLDAWLAERTEAIRAEDNAQVKAWLDLAKARSDSGLDPRFQLELVKGEFLKSCLDWEDAKRGRVHAWNALKALSDIPEKPRPLEYALDEMGIAIDSELQTRYQNGALRRASIARQNLEASQANLSAALSNSRWGLSSSYSKEGEERITKIGIAYRFPRAGEASAIRAEQRARIEAGKRVAELELAELDLRFAAALQTIESNQDLPESPDTAAALEALTLRLVEGKDRPSDVIPIRRQFLEIRLAELQRAHSLYRAHAELLTLTSENTP